MNNPEAFKQMTLKALVDWYNANVPFKAQVKKFRDKQTAERRCVEVLKTLMQQPEADEVSEAAPVKRPVLSASLSLDRTITCITTGEVFKNAHRMWVANPDWMTGGQQDRLTQQLYAAAKRGEHVVVEINNREFQLVNAPKVN